MILHSIKTQGWRCFSEPVHLGPLSESLNVIHGPNAIGKSTLFEALIRGVFDGHRVRGSEVESLRPWGRELAPEVEIEFEQEGICYRITKGFLDRSVSLLERFEEGRFVRLSEGDAADARMRKMFFAAAPAKGFSKAEHRGLSQVLWAPQGEIALNGLSGDLLARIRDSLGQQVAGTGMGPVEKKAGDLYGQFYTPKGKLRRGKGGAPELALEEELRELRKERDHLQESLDLFETLSKKVRALREEHKKALKETAYLEERVGITRERLLLYDTLASQAEQQEAREKQAEREYAEIKTRMDKLVAIRKDLKDSAVRTGELEAALSLIENDLATKRRDEGQARVDLEKARKDRSMLESIRNRCKEGVRFLELRKKLEETSLLIKNLGEKTHTLETLLKKHGEMNAPDPKAMDHIRKAEREKRDTRLRLDASMIHLEILPETDLFLEVLKGEAQGEIHIGENERAHVKGASEIHLEIKGVAAISARGPETSVAGIRSELERLEGELARLYAPFPQKELNALEKAFQEARALEGIIDRTREVRETLLSGRTEAAIQKEKTALESEMRKILESYPEWAEGSPDLEGLNRQLEESERRAVSVEEAERVWDGVSKELSLFREKKSRLESELHGFRERMHSLKEREREILSDGLDERERESRLKKTSLEWDAAKAKTEEIKSKLRQYSENPRDALKRLEVRRSEALDRQALLLAEEKEASGELKALATQAPYGRFTEKVERIAILERRLSDEKNRTRAIKLLYETMEGMRQKALSSVSGPVERSASKIFQKIAGTGLSEVRLGEAFGASGVSSGGNTASVSALSGGEREQLHLSVRLALAEVLASGGRTLAVFDDVLTATDSPRFKNVLEVLVEATRHLQVVILTCHPERYEGLSQARFFDLESLLRSPA